MEGLPLDRLRLSPDAARLLPKKKRPIIRHRRGWFIKGPIPGPWIARAASLGGKSLHVGMALWYLAGVRKSRQVKLTTKVINRFGIGPKAARVGLRRLEEAGLVSVFRGHGRLPVATLLDFADPE